METAPTQPCPSRPALRPNCQIYPLPFTSQCGALGSAMGQAIGIDTSQAKHVLCRTDILSQSGPRCPMCRAQSNSPSIAPPTNTTTILSSPRWASNRYSRSRIDPNSSTPPTRSEERSIERNHREKNQLSNFKSTSSGLFYGWEKARGSPVHSASFRQ